MKVVVRVAGALVAFVASWAMAGCTGEPPGRSSATSMAESQSEGGIATSAPSSVPGPVPGDGVGGLDVQLSSSSTAEGEPVQVTISASPELADGEVVVLMESGDAGQLIAVTPLVPFDDAGSAYVTLQPAVTSTFLAAVVEGEAPDSAFALEDLATIGTSGEFTISVLRSN